jgi:hypothetical protein
MSLSCKFPGTLTRLAFVGEDSRLLIERWIPPEPPQRWLVGLAVDEGSPEDFLRRAELLCAQRSSFSAGDNSSSPARKGALSAADALAYASNIGPLRPLTKEECRQLWSSLGQKTDPSR